MTSFRKLAISVFISMAEFAVLNVTLYIDYKYIYKIMFVKCRALEFLMGINVLQFTCWRMMCGSLITDYRNVSYLSYALFFLLEIRGVCVL